MQKDLTFKKMKEEDVPFFVSLRNSCVDYLHCSEKFTEEQALNWFDNTNPLFYIINLEEKEFPIISTTKIGYFRTSNYSKTNKNIYIGADISEEYRGKGMGTKAYLKFIPFLFKELDLHKISLEVLETNERAAHLYTKVGFVIEGVKREETLKDGKYVNSIVMSILKREWESDASP